MRMSWERVVPVAAVGIMLTGGLSGCTDEAPQDQPAAPAYTYRGQTPEPYVEPFIAPAEVPGETVLDVLDSTRMRIIGMFACAAGKAGPNVSSDPANFTNEYWAKGKDHERGTKDDGVYFRVTRDGISNVITYGFSDGPSKKVVEMRTWVPETNRAVQDGNAPLTLRQLVGAGRDPKATTVGLSVTNGTYSRGIAQHDVNSVTVWDETSPRGQSVERVGAGFSSANAVSTKALATLKAIFRVGGLKRCA